MNEASQWRLQLARHFAPAYTTHPEVRAVIVGGSAAEGHADRYSDVEIGVFWDRPPTEAERRQAVERAGGVQLSLDAYDSQRDVGIEDFYVDQVNIDVVHRTVAGTDRLIADVVDQHDSTVAKQTVIHALHHAVPLLDAPELARWRQRTAAYPNALVQAVVAQQLRFNPWWSVEVLAERQSVILVHYALSIATERVVTTLVALNRRYFPGLKWLPTLVASLTVAPHDLGNRLERCFHGELGARVGVAAALVEETFDLVEQHLPDLDVQARRERFRQCRQPIDALPSRFKNQV